MMSHVEDQTVKQIQHTSGQEQSFILACQRGDEGAIRKLYNDYRIKVASTVRFVIGPCQDFDDIIQQVFIEVIRSIRNYKGESKLSTWIYRICVNVALQYLRRVKKERRMAYFDMTQDPVFERSLKVNPIARLEDRELLGHLYQLLEEIQEKKRTVFVLHELNGMDIEEISEILKIPENTVKSRLFHGRSEMLKKMKKRKII